MSNAADWPGENPEFPLDWVMRPVFIINVGELNTESEDWDGEEKHSAGERIDT